MNFTEKNKNLFILDDDDIFHRIMAMANRNNFFRISHHYDVKSILAHLCKYKDDHAKLPDVIFADLTIPEYDGWYFLNMYQKLCHLLCKDIMIYVVSASVSQFDMDRAANYSFVKQYITKPIPMSKFEEIAGLETYKASA
jgi:response regulator RpfG family c-di-GMP phosphodiesterase